MQTLKTKIFLMFFLLAAPGFVGGSAWGQAPASAEVNTWDITPRRPLTEATLRKYLDVLQWTTKNREALVLEFAQQEKDLPPWFPVDVLHAEVKATLEIDQVKVVLPVYQRYYSEGSLAMMGRLYATPYGQKLVSSMYKAEVANEAKGDSATVARDKALDATPDDGDQMKVMVEQLPAAERKDGEAFTHSMEWTTIQLRIDRFNADLQEAQLAEQRRVMGEIVGPHRDEIMAAKKAYDEKHPESKD